MRAARARAPHAKLADLRCHCNSHKTRFVYRSLEAPLTMLGAARISFPLKHSLVFRASSSNQETSGSRDRYSRVASIRQRLLNERTNVARA